MLKKFWEWIRRLFAAPPEKTDQALSTEKRRAWFEQCEPGFLVWARMPLPEEELAKVEPAHQIRPYLILAKTETELTAKACSSSPYSGLREYQTVTLAKDHPLTKQTYIDLKPVSYTHLRRTLTAALTARRSKRSPGSCSWKICLSARPARFPAASGSGLRWAGRCLRKRRCC